MFNEQIEQKFYYNHMILKKKKKLNFKLHVKGNYSIHMHGTLIKSFMYHKIICVYHFILTNNLIDTYTIYTYI